MKKVLNEKRERGETTTTSETKAVVKDEVSRAKQDNTVGRLGE
jgi:hypothetical protein